MLAALSSVHFNHESINRLGFEAIGPSKIYTRLTYLGGINVVLNLRDRLN